MFINLLATILLFVLAQPIIRLLFERGALGPPPPQEASWALVCLAPGLVAFSLVNILARAFYALGDTKTPMKISIFCLGLNLIFALVFVWRWRQGGLGIANTISACFNVFLFFYALRRKLGRWNSGAAAYVVAIILAGALAGVTAVLVSMKWESALGHHGLPRRIGAVFVPMRRRRLLLGDGIGVQSSAGDGTWRVDLGETAFWKKQAS